MLLVLDMGNSNIVAALMDGNVVRRSMRIPTDRTRPQSFYETSLRGFMSKGTLQQEAEEPLRAVISSVVPELNDRLSAAATAVTGTPTTILDDEMVRSAITIDVDEPSAVGKDRIADAVGALSQFPAPLIAIDMGTATTVNVVDAHRRFIGGMIIPGVLTSLNALSAKASQLPEIPLATPPSIIGKNTVHCMQSGIVYAFAAMIDGIIDRIADELSATSKAPFTVVATGGLSPFVIPQCRHDIHYDEHLLLKGIVSLCSKLKS